jgi:hypothetical protein
VRLSQLAHTVKRLPQGSRTGRQPARTRRNAVDEKAQGLPDDEVVEDLEAPAESQEQVAGGVDPKCAAVLSIWTIPEG